MKISATARSNLMKEVRRINLYDVFFYFIGCFRLHQHDDSKLPAKGTAAHIAAQNEEERKKEAARLHKGPFRPTSASSGSSRAGIKV